MNSFFALTVAAVLVAVASASEFEGEFGHEGGLGHEGRFGHHLPLGHGPVVPHRRGRFGHRGHGIGGVGIEEEGLLGEGGFGRRGGFGGERFGEGISARSGHRFRRGFRGGLGGPGLEAGAIGGGFGGAQSAGLLAAESEGFNEAGLAEGKRGGILANKKGIRANRFNANQNDLDTFHKHNAVDKDTLVVKNNVKAVNDEDAVHSSRGNVNSNSVGAGSENLAAFGEEGRVAGSKGANRNSLVAGNQNSNFGAAGGAAGIAA